MYTWNSVVSAYNIIRNTYPIMGRFIYHIIILYMSVMYLMNGNVRMRKIFGNFIRSTTIGTESCQYIVPNIIPMTFGNVLRLQCFPYQNLRCFTSREKFSFMYHDVCSWGNLVCVRKHNISAVGSFVWSLSKLCIPLIIIIKMCYGIVELNV